MSGFVCLHPRETQNRLNVCMCVYNSSSSGINSGNNIIIIIIIIVVFASE